MTFRKKAFILSALVIALIIANILTIVIKPGKSTSFAWLDPSLLGAIDRIEIFGRENRAALVRKNNKWFVQGETAEYPVKQTRVDDLLSALSRKAVYPKRAASNEARTALALEEGHASRILIKGGQGLPLLDLLVGTADALGREVYLRKAGQTEIYSGEDLFTLYTESQPRSWYNLRLFPSDGSAVALDAVQQAEISFSPGSGEKKSYMLRRQRGLWMNPGNESAVLDSQRAETWLRSVLEAEAEDFTDHAPENIDNRITLRLGDGSTRIIQAGAMPDGKTAAMVSNSSLVYVIGEYAAKRIFIESEYFEKK